MKRAHLSWPSRALHLRALTMASLSCCGARANMRNAKVCYCVACWLDCSANAQTHWMVSPTGAFAAA